MTTTHPDALGLLRTILEHPADDAARLIYADWLEEHGEQERAEFIRRGIAGDQRQCQVPKNLSAKPASGEAYRQAWPGAYWAFHSGLPAGIEVVWKRGFVHTVICRLGDWIGGNCHCDSWREPCPNCPVCRGSGLTPAHGPAIAAAHPVERVGITDREPQGTAWLDEGTSSVNTRAMLPRWLWHLTADLATAGVADPRERLSRALLLWARQQ